MFHKLFCLFAASAASEDSISNQKPLLRLDEEEHDGNESKDADMPVEVGMDTSSSLSAVKNGESAGNLRYIDETPGVTSKKFF
jgi:hypothetical protein